METARLILEYTQALIWPTITLFGLLLFRKPLVAVLERLRGAGLPGGVSLDFEQEVRDAEVLSREVARAPRKVPEPSTPMLPVTQAN